jgi:nitrite reductase/ring-hydroxylating ferredoxin subunit
LSAAPLSAVVSEDTPGDLPDHASAVCPLEAVPARGSYLFTVVEPSGREEEVILLRADGEDADGVDSGTDDGTDPGADDHGADAPVAAWKNFCMHEPDQRLDRGLSGGAATRDGGVICPKHGSIFDAATGACDNGPAAGQSLVSVAVAVVEDTVYLVDDGFEFAHEGPVDDDDDDVPSSTSHLGF